MDELSEWRLVLRLRRGRRARFVSPYEVLVIAKGHGRRSINEVAADLIDDVRAVEPGAERLVRADARAFFKTLASSPPQSEVEFFEAARGRLPEAAVAILEDTYAYAGDRSDVALTDADMDDEIAAMSGLPRARRRRIAS